MTSANRELIAIVFGVFSHSKLNRSKIDNVPRGKNCVFFRAVFVVEKRLCLKALLITNITIE